MGRYPHTIKTPAKINLVLRVFPKRKDGFHRLFTIAEKVALYDTVSVRPRRDGAVKVTSNIAAINGEKNLAYKAAVLLLREKGIFGEKGANIRIQKRIPMGAGLGGGSSDAAATLTLVDNMYPPRLSAGRRMRLAKKIGSDVMFFLEKSPFLTGRGQPDTVRGIPGLARTRLWHVIIWPNIEISTRQIYMCFDARRPRKTPRIALTTILGDVRINKLIFARLVRCGGKYIINDLQSVVERTFPQIKKLCAFLRKQTGKTFFVTGSGSAVYTIVASKAAAVTIKHALPKALKKSAFVVCTARHA